jgi:hypothetical protein
MAQTHNKEKNIQWQCPNMDDGSLFTVLTSIIEATLLAVVKTVNEGMPDHSQRMRKFWGVRCEPSHEKGLQI